MRATAMRNAYYASVVRERAIFARIPSGLWRQKNFLDKALGFALRLFVR